MPITVRTVWKTKKDAHVCPICKALEGYSWTVDAGDPYPKRLIHPLYGPVYDLRPAANGSLIKEAKGHHCRCTLQHQLEASNAADDEIVAPKLTCKQMEKRIGQQE